MPEIVVTEDMINEAQRWLGACITRHQIAEAIRAAIRASQEPQS